MPLLSVKRTKIRLWAESKGIGPFPVTKIPKVGVAVARVLWDRTARLIKTWPPAPRMYHPSPLRRLGVVTWGKGRMRESYTSRSVERVTGNRQFL